MKKRNVMSLAALLLGTTMVCAQQFYQVPTDYVRSQIFSVNDLTGGGSYQGSPYLEDEFAYGRILVGGKDLPGLLRYNAYYDIFEVQVGPAQINQIEKTDDLAITIGPKIYRVVTTPEDGKIHAQVIVRAKKEGDYAVWKVSRASFTEARAATSSYDKAKPARFSVDSQYYMQKGDGTLQAFKLKKKAVMELLGNDKDLGAFIKSNKIKFKGEEDLRKVFDFMNMR